MTYKANVYIWNFGFSLNKFSLQSSNSSIISKDFLKESLKSLDEKKRDHSLCSKCTKLGIPPYQLGVNLKGWDEKAKENSEIFAKKLR